MTSTPNRKAKTPYPDSPTSVSCDLDFDFNCKSTYPKLCFDDEHYPVKKNLEEQLGEVVVVDVKQIEPTEITDTVLESLTSHEKEKIQNLRQYEDWKRSVVSTLLQRKIIRKQLGCGDSEYEIKRTQANKPYVVSCYHKVGNWNYNTSHHGSYVGITSATDHLVGIDIVALSPRRSWQGSAAAYVKLFKYHFTAIELRESLLYPTDREVYNHFFINWSLKEAYIKAVGDGLQMDLSTIEFNISFRSNYPSGRGGIEGYAIARIDNRPCPQWSFTFSSLDNTHVITVARGPLPGEIADAYHWPPPPPPPLSCTELCLFDLLQPRGKFKD